MSTILNNEISEEDVKKGKIEDVNNAFGVEALDDNSTDEAVDKLFVLVNNLENMDESVDTICSLFDESVSIKSLCNLYNITEKEADFIYKGYLYDQKIKENFESIKDAFEEDADILEPRKVEEVKIDKEAIENPSESLKNQTGEKIVKEHK